MQALVQNRGEHRALWFLTVLEPDWAHVMEWREAYMEWRGMFEVAYKITFEQLLEARVGTKAILRLLLADLEEELEERVWEREALELVGEGGRVKQLRFHTAIRPYPADDISKPWHNWGVDGEYTRAAQGLEVVVRVGE